MYAGYPILERPATVLARRPQFFPKL